MRLRLFFAFINRKNYHQHSRTKVSETAMLLTGGCFHCHKKVTGKTINIERRHSLPVYGRDFFMREYEGKHTILTVCFLIQILQL